MFNYKKFILPSRRYIKMAYLEREANVSLSE